MTVAEQITDERLIERLVEWLRKHGEPNSGISYESNSRFTGHARVEVHGSDATFIADHFHGEGARDLASVLTELQHRRHVTGSPNIEHVDADTLSQHRKEAEAGTDESFLCPICAVAFKPDDMCLTDINEGTCHATCLEGAPMVDLDTGAALPPDAPPPKPYRFDPLPSGASSEDHP